MFEELIDKIRELDLKAARELLIKMNTKDLNNIDEKGRTVLHILVQVFLDSEKKLSDISILDQREIKKLNVFNTNIETVIKLAVEKMSDWALNLTDNDGMTALNYASVANNYDISWILSGMNVPKTYYTQNSIGVVGDELMYEIDLEDYIVN